MDESTLFPEHVFDALGVDPIVHPDKIGGAVMVIEKRPDSGPVTVMTAGVSRLPTDSGERVELAVEVPEDQVGAAVIALKIVCDDVATNHRVPPVGTPWRNPNPFLGGTEISAIVVTGSRHGSSFDEVRNGDGAVVGHVRTLRMITDAEAAHVSAHGWDDLVEKAGSLDALLDVERTSVVQSPGLPDNAPVFVSKLHAEHPPRWITISGSELQSVTGLESPEYMNDPANHDVWSVSSFVARFPWVSAFVQNGRSGETALFTDASGAYVIEDD